MAKISKSVVDKNLRDMIFDVLFIEGWDMDGNSPIIKEGFEKINDRQYGAILTDLNGVERYVRIGAIVAEEREDMTARELMQSEQKAYQEKQEAKAQKEKEKAEKAKRDKAERERKKAEKEAAENV